MDNSLSLTLAPLIEIARAFSFVSTKSNKSDRHFLQKKRRALCNARVLKHETLQGEKFPNHILEQIEDATKLSLLNFKKRDVELTACRSFRRMILSTKLDMMSAILTFAVG